MVKTRLEKLPPELNAKLKVLSGSEEHSPQKMASWIKEASDRYISGKQNNLSPWHQDSFEKAYLAYYLPLNYLRASAVVREAKKIGFFSSNDWVEFGSGPGTLHLALEEQNVKFKNYTFIEHEDKALLWHERILEPGPEIQFQKSYNQKMDLSNATLAFSYSLNELGEEVPEWMFSAESLFIIEPSTNGIGRKLMELRQKALDKGYYAWAPCTHQGACPLLTQSKTDWCHDRVFIEIPDWLKSIEDQLPIQNRSVTFSYLLLKRTPPPVTKAGVGRTIGDTMYEKGKARQMFCQGSDREFLAWLKRHGEPQEIPRGSRIRVPHGSEKKSNEIRITTEVEIL